MAIIIDFETRSEADIDWGIRRYASHPSTHPLMLAWCDTEAGDEVHQWFPNQPVNTLPWAWEPNTKVYAFNTDFESEIWEHVMVKKYGLPPIPMHRWEDVQSLCSRYSLPRNLHDVCKALDVPPHLVKSYEGSNLIKLFCCPPFAGVIGGAEWASFCHYNRQDIVATREVLRRLPMDRLSESEREIFELNWEINLNGLPVNVMEAARIYEAIQAYIAEHNQLLPELTGGKVTKVTQVKRITQWLYSVGVCVDNLRADTVGYLLSILTDTTPQGAAAIQVLELRAATGLSSVGKFKRIVEMACDGRMYFNSKYYGAHTGRITGTGFQLLNLPRAKVKDPEAEIRDFMTGDIMERNPVMSGRALVRPMICAPEGTRLLCADYSSIEFILLVWLAGDAEAVKHFANGLDQYKMLAMDMYGVPYDEVSKDQRQMGKVGILGCGYGLGVHGCIRYALQYGLELSEEEARQVVTGYRTKYPGVPQLWYDLSEAAMSAVQCPGEKFTAFRTTFRTVHSKGRKYLQMVLPSGRAMYYHNPRIDEGKFGPLVFVEGVNQLTRQWQDKEMTPGKWAENVIQAIGRDLLYYGKFKLREAGYKIIGSIYDEVIAEVPNGFGSLQEFESLMASVPPWATGLPVRAEGWEGRRYRKD